MNNYLKKLIEEEGAIGAVTALENAMSDFADEMSDLGIKELALDAAEVSEMLGYVKKVLND